MKVPKLCRQKTKYSDLSFVRIFNKKFYCGAWGSPQSKTGYLKIISAWTLAMATIPPPLDDDDWDWEMSKNETKIEKTSKNEKSKWGRAILRHVERNTRKLPPPTFNGFNEAASYTQKLCIGCK